MSSPSIIRRSCDIGLLASTDATFIDCFSLTFLILFYLPLQTLNDVGVFGVSFFLLLFNPLNFYVDSSIIFLMGPFPPGLTFVIFLTLLVVWFHPFALSYLLAWKPCILLMQASHTVEHAVSLLHLQCFLVDIQNPDAILSTLSMLYPTDQLWEWCFASNGSI